MINSIAKLRLENSLPHTLSTQTHSLHPVYVFLLALGGNVCRHRKTFQEFLEIKEQI